MRLPLRTIIFLLTAVWSGARAQEAAPTFEVASIRLHTNPLAASRLGRPHVITVVDGILGDFTLSKHREAVAQLIAAHTVLISKQDLRTSNTRELDLACLNPWARIIRAEARRRSIG